MRREHYTVVVEDAGGNFSAYVPDLPGCVSTGSTADEALANMREAIQFHIDGMLEDGQEPPRATSRSTQVEAVIGR